ncbi:esterase/lipase family protein [Allostreptomyces psammosilenae]|uniref:Pimeloyl-ACP methyl ester carboxylesterase n=1 Tax=Allostreptomyces psammosilenae TaxID=1892865 RepID=A0A853ACI0_9ACTN|nr:alpha/beta hydrolase [Allostreptomyces psammosilenae]NYI08168.1 pimeloyl-ACP methyl ester carboxylesterase [Allostreptomyces psammosilenae]
MTTFVLVHGAWHGPWAWDRLTPLLHRAGARTVTPALTLEADTGLHDHVREVVTALDATAGADDLVLVGHSYAGLVVRQAADQRPGAVRHVVLVDGWAGRDGASMFGLAPRGFADAVRAAARAGADGRQVPAPPPASFGVTDPHDADRLARRLRPQPLRSFTEATRLSGAVDRIPGTAVYCRPLTYPFDRLGTAIGYRPIPLDGPHDIMLTHPRALADLLLHPQVLRFGIEKLED